MEKYTANALLHITSCMVSREHALIGGAELLHHAISALLHYTQDGLSPDTPKQGFPGENASIRAYRRMH